MLHKLPKISYNLDENPRIISNIFRRISLNHAENAERYNLLSDYYIRDNDTPEGIALQFYGNVTYWWVVLVINPQIYRRDQWPMSDSQLQQWLDDNHGNNQNDPIANGTDFDLPFVVDGVVNDHHTFFPSDKSRITTIATRAFMDNENKRKIKILTPAHLREFVTEYESATSQIFRSS